MKNIFLIVLASLLISCGKDRSGIPDVPVNFHIRLDNPSMHPLNTPGGSVVVNGYGVAGIIIHRSAFGDAYMAFDRCSTVDPEKKCAVVVDDHGLTATDPCSKAIFSLEDGMPQGPPAEIPLKKYNVSIQNNTIYIIN
ncbi:Rieske (2Fe-2S) protein [Paradesertivirga mongoliensis]|uniref:Rieske (2Fe-2S) protein n=1 Tax=Paradesertivirga mongoliensis TaxID=2100740 RepID=A0ABW4ZKZ1_9SPHI|nr:hypothetical protein [Pedobacter mongoliensis]